MANRKVKQKKCKKCQQAEIGKKRYDENQKATGSEGDDKDAMVAPGL